MANATFYLPAARADFKTSAFPAITRFQGTNFPIQVLAYDTTSREDAFFSWCALNYASGNVTATVYWYADTASSGGVTWGCALAAITPNTDTQDIETKAYATENTANDTHLGTTGQRLHTVDVTITNLDSLTADDWVSMKVGRVVSDGGDTMAGDALLVGIKISYLAT